MSILPLNFMILQLCGVWRPSLWSSGWKKCIYTCYTCFIFFITYTFTLSEFIEFVISIDDIQQVAQNSLMLLSMLGICYKIANFVWKREEILRLRDMLGNDICRPRGYDEVAIQVKFNHLGRINTAFFGGLAETAVIAITLGSFLENVPQRTLPFKAWLPFDTTTYLGFWIAFLHQILAHGIAATIGSIHDTLFYGLMIQTCAQLNILKLRLRTMPNNIKVADKSVLSVVGMNDERIELGKCIRHHHEIFKFAELSNDIFSVVIFIQFSISTVVICVSTYTLSNTSFLSPEFAFILVYLVCMIVQIFLLCWNGNEVIIESMDVSTAVYEMNWSLLNRATKQDLRIIMTRALDPIRYTSGHVITLSLDAYNSLMKLSYSAYNLLQRTSA